MYHVCLDTSYQSTFALTLLLSHSSQPTFSSNILSFIPISILAVIYIQSGMPTIICMVKSIVDLFCMESDSESDVGFSIRGSFNRESRGRLRPKNHPLLEMTRHPFRD